MTEHILALLKERKLAANNNNLPLRVVSYLQQIQQQTFLFLLNYSSQQTFDSCRLAVSKHVHSSKRAS